MKDGNEWATSPPIWFDSPRQMSLGLMVPIREGSMGGETPRFRDFVEMATLARDIGFEVIWFPDHFTMEHEGELAGVWECWTLMAAVAASVPGIHVGPLVSCTGFRNPGLIAKMTETMDEISGGRFILGIGAGWNEIEYRQFGYPFDYRASRFEEAVQVIHPLLREGQANYQGRFLEANEAINQPRGPRPSGAPMLIGSNGNRLLKTVARYADAWNSDWEDDPAKMATLIANVDAACVEIGRPTDSLVKTGSTRFAMDDAVPQQAGMMRGSPDEIVERMAAFQAFGLQHLVCGLEPRTTSTIAAFGDVIAKLDSR
jgi:alkanesulfonate monooxygenase SsuD/methylene tetrahydromethanopterin reductase-like flavin-dependent oxidoreductase (luciferase family)